MKKRIILALSTLLGLQGFAQQDPQFSQNAFNRMAVNPGYAGSNGFLCGTLIGRQQWAGFAGSPRTFAFSADMPIMKESSMPGGVGLTIISDKLGLETNFYAKAAYAYRLILPTGTLGIGLEIGALQKSFGGLFKPTEGSQGSANPDPSIPFGGISQTKFDLGFGAFYQIPNKLFFGVSAGHLTAPSYSGGTASNSFNYLTARHIYVIGGYEFSLPNNPSLVFKPNFMYKTSLSSNQIDVNALVFYNNMIWGGVSYRILGNDALVPMVGYQGTIMEGKGNYRIGYSYDATLSRLRTASSGSHEVMLGFCYDITPKVKVTKYVNPRFL
jgi:type IX secretion system PorP/SprF family membrane protein